MQSELKTNRLILRDLSVDDYEDLHDIRFHPQVIKFIERERIEDKLEIKTFITDRLKAIENKSLCFWGITEQGSSKLIGTICLWNFNPAKTVAEIGYELHPDHHTQGLMSEAMKAVLNFGFKQLHLNAIEAFTHKNNESSKALLSKFNFKLDVQRKDDEYPDNIIYTLQYA